MIFIMYLRKVTCCTSMQDRDVHMNTLTQRNCQKNICILDELFHVSALPVYSVEIQTSFKDNGPFRSLATALNLCFSNTKDGGIFICNGTSVAVFSSDSEFHVFSPHARD